MEIIKLDLNSNIKILKPCLLCIGFFDGVHLGHQELFLQADKYDLKKYALTFSFSFKHDKLISTFKEKMYLMEKFNIEKVFIVEVNKALIKTSSIDFINLYLKKINPRLIICGQDFRFGYKNLGNSDLLKQYFNVDVVKLLTIDNQKVSSTFIRQCLINGDIKTANRYLGYNYFYFGVVRKGLGNGQKFGFKTANIDIDKDLINLRRGVYICNVQIKNKTYHGICNIGVHPTLSQLKNPIVEVHVFDIDDIYVGEELIVIFYDFLRDEMKFDDFEKLKKQVFSDIKYAKTYFLNKNIENKI